MRESACESACVQTVGFGDIKFFFSSLTSPCTLQHGSSLRKMTKRVEKSTRERERKTVLDEVRSASFFKQVCKHKSHCSKINTCLKFLLSVNFETDCIVDL